MLSATILNSTTALPEPSDMACAQNGLARLREKYFTVPQTESPFSDEKAFNDFLAHPRIHALLLAIFGNSPFLTECLLKDIGRLDCLCRTAPQKEFDQLLSQLKEDLRTVTDKAIASKALRIAKRRIALLIAVADIAHLWRLEEITLALSQFAELACQLALDVALKNAIRNGDLSLNESDDASLLSQNDQDNCGLVIIGMGKLGAYELNYSSDIDLIAFFDPTCPRLTGKRMPSDCYIRILRDVVSLLQERTADGYVFRVDLRLRPDPGATPIAVSLPAAETYYTSMGQNWERAAMIKARSLAGDRSIGAEFHKLMRPFVWRKFLDFAAIQDIQSIKRQIAAHKGGLQIELPGHNVKLGRGGIREIEFFAQTQQLIWGGRQTELRVSRTEEALEQIVYSGLLKDSEKQSLCEAYRYLRHVEHRLQMQNDQQTQTLPKNEEDLLSLAIFLGYKDIQSFEKDLLKHLHCVAELYDNLFNESDRLSAKDRATDNELGSLVFTGEDEHPDTLKTLLTIGFKDPAKVTKTVRAWHRGRIRATRSERARQLLTELMPLLLQSLGKTADPDGALLRFDEFLSQLPAGVQLMSLFNNNPQLLDLVAEIMGSAPHLAQILSRHPILLDGVLDNNFSKPLPSSTALGADLDLTLNQARDFQDVLDLARRWNNDRKFQLGMSILQGMSDAHKASGPLSDIADVLLSRMLAHVEGEFAQQHGVIPGASLAILAYGKLGSRELTYTSDLDLVFVYDLPPQGPDSPPLQSDGAKPLTPTVYFQRLSQRLINALSARTGEGILFEVDMRLRPSGNQGPIACSLESFVQYQKENAWTWEHLALTRARVAAGPPDSIAKLSREIRNILIKSRDKIRLKTDIADMRKRMALEHKPKGDFDLKHRRGGLVDLEFLVQFLLLQHAHTHAELLDIGIAACLSRLTEAQILTENEGYHLIDACRLWHKLSGLLRLTVGDEGFSLETAPIGLQKLLMETSDTQNLEDLRNFMQEKLDFVSKSYEKYLGAEL